MFLLKDLNKKIVWLLKVANHFLLYNLKLEHPFTYQYPNLMQIIRGSGLKLNNNPATAYVTTATGDIAFMKHESNSKFSLDIWTATTSKKL